MIDLEAARLDSIRQVSRDLIERQMEATDPVAAYDAAEKAAWEGVPECQPPTKS
jgi:hypothetical protein